VASFGSYLLRRLQVSGMIQFEFARRTKVSRGLIGDLIHDRRPLPKNHEDRFIKALGLTGEEAQHFLDWAELSRSPKRIQKLVLAAYPKLRELAEGK
jgi:hypothetical protein